MADNTVNVGINVTDNGTTAGITKNVKNLKDVLDQAAVSAAKVSSSTATPITAAASPTTSRIIAASTTPGMSVGEGKDYGTSRAIGGGTGAEGRDFAKESVGLGGVVRLYATFAANIYAVSTAFEALNKANAAERMMKASEMLSITMGANLKGIAKNLQEVTDYSLSMQEATQFTNMGISAGIAGKQIENLTKIAKGAASALGRDTGESIKRIITGTAKQEQEILDELGIFIKAKDAYKEYAQKFDIKGGAEALTAQQKVVAYADAVEKAGEKWKEFADIPDPFSKFKAKGSEALQELLTNINKLIEPIISFLAESTDRIKAIMVLLGVILTKRALPELANLFTNLFTFDSAKAKAEGNLARRVAIDEYVATTNALEAKQAERAAMLAKPMGKPELAGTVAQAAGGLAAAKGVPGGIDVTKLTSAIAAKDLALYESRAQIENKVLGTLEAQVKVSQDKSIVVQKLIDQGLISNKSTETNLILGKEGLSIAEKTFASISANNNQLKTQALIDAEIVGLENQKLITREKLVLLGKAGGTIPLSGTGGSLGAATTAGAAAGAAATGAASGATAINTAATEANTAAVVANNVAKNAGIVATEASALATIPAITALEAYNRSLAKSAGLQATLSTAMGLGPIASLKVFGTVMLEALIGIFKFEAGMTVGARAAQVFGASVTAAAAGVRILWMSINALLIPVMLGITVWEMFGDKIKEFIGINTELQKATEESNKKNKEHADALGLAGAAMQKLNEQREKGLNTLDDLAAANKVEVTLIEEVLNSYKTAEDAKRQEAKQTILDKAKKAAEEKGIVFDATAYLLEQAAIKKGLLTDEGREIQRLASEQQKYTNLTIEYNKKEQESLAAVTRAKTDLQNIKIINSSVTDENDKDKAARIETETSAQRKLNAAEADFAKLRNDRLTTYEKLKQAVINLLTEDQKAAQQQASNIAARQTAEKSYDNFLVETEKRRKEVLDPSSGIKDVKIEAGINNLKVLANVTGDATTKSLSYKTLLKELQETQKATITNQQAHTASLAAYALVQEMINKGTIGQEEGLKTLNELFLQIGLGMQKMTTAPIFRPYTDKALADFIKLKGTVEEAGMAIKRSNMELADTSKIDARTKAVQGYSTEEIIAETKSAQLKQAGLEYLRETTQALLEYKKVADKKDRTEDPKERAAQVAEAKVQRDLKMEQAKLTFAQGVKNAETIEQDSKISLTLGQIVKKYESIDRVMAESNAKNNAALDLDKARLDSLSQLNAYSERGLALKTQSLEQDRIASTYSLSLAQAAKDRAKAQEELDAKISEGSVVATARATEEKRIEEIYQNKIRLASTANNLAKDTLKISTDTKLRIAEQNEIVEKQNFDLGRLEVLKARELITNDEYLARKRVLELSAIQQNADRERNITLEAYNKDLEGLQGLLAGLMELGIPTEDTEGQIKAITAAADIRLASMKRIKDAKVDQAEWDAKQNERQIGYTEVFKSSFASMGDAIVEFAKTGKLNFKSLINDMIAGLVKLELKMAMTRMMEGMGGFGGLASKAISFLMGTTGSGGGTAATDSFTLGRDMPLAKGGAFDGGIKTFAMGGAFSNSIVSSPTLFKFASGTGLMGEAGPEAIMPLKRDPQGNLGVRSGGSGGSNVEVVVNNYSTQQATTKETTDSKGNRKIEVVIGDMSAGEITRSGSSSQRAIRSTFGMQPQLIRR